MTQYNSNTTPHVAYAFDAGFRYCSILSAYSILKHRSGPTRISFLTGKDLPGLSAAVALLQESFPEASLEIMVRPELDLSFDTGHRLPAAAFARLFLPRYIDGRVLYLDGDTYARRDIGPLYHTDMQGKAFGAALDSAVERKMHYTTAWWPFRKHKPSLKQKLANPHLLGLWRYVNSGVLLLDFDKARELGVLEQVFDPQAAVNFDSKYQLGMGDQDWLNHIARGMFHILEPEWNALWGNARSARPPLPYARRRAYRASRVDPAIVHLTGKGKPWLEHARKRRSAARRWQRECQALMAEMTGRLGVDLRHSLL